jgi:hypothetical protein
VTVSLTLDDVRAWIQTPATVLSDEQLQALIDGETAVQAQVCRIDPDIVQPQLNEALQRRVSRAAAARGVPLGLLGDAGEYGPVALRRYDGEIERLEQPTRIFAIG